MCLAALFKGRHYHLCVGRTYLYLNEDNSLHGVVMTLHCDLRRLLAGE